MDGFTVKVLESGHYELTIKQDETRCYKVDLINMYMPRVQRDFKVKTKEQEYTNMQAYSGNTALSRILLWFQSHQETFLQCE